MMKRKLIHAEREHFALRGNERGAALVIALLVMLVLSVLGSGLLSVSFTETQVAFNDRRMIQALFNAEAALEEAKMRLSPTATTGKIDTTGVNANWGRYIYTPSHANDYQTFDPDYQATYTGIPSVQNTIEWGVAKIRAKIVAGSNPPQVETTKDGKPILLVTAWGADGQIRRQLELELEPITNPAIKRAAHGIKDVTVSGFACTDSYDSTVGPYDPLNPGNQGGISTEGTTAPAIKLKESSQVKGQAVVVTDATVDPHTVVDATEETHITPPPGTPKVDKASTSTLPAVPSGVVPPEAIPLNSDKGKNNLNLSGSSVRVVPEGIYWVNNLHISGSAKLVTTGNVKIYVMNNLTISQNGTLAPANSRPINLTIIAGATGVDDFTEGTPGVGYEAGKVQLTGDASLYAVIFGPQAKVKLSGNGGLFGAVHAKGVNLTGNACIHYDTSLGVPNPVTGYNRKAWHEVVN